MDPMACLLRLDQAISDLDWPEAVSALNDYYRWRLGGGFEPIPGRATIRGQSRGDQVGDRDRKSVV